jgi:ankyrin repeat protein
LHYAATRGLKKIIELLIARGADVNTKIEVGDYKGQTPLDGAIQWNHPETATLLRKHGGKTAEELKAEGK